MINRLFPMLCGLNNAKSWAIEGQGNEAMTAGLK
jgi:hypothetical protein